MKMPFNLCIKLVLNMLFVLFIFSFRLIGDVGQIKIRWKNGDVLPGRILQSQNPILSFSSELFQDNLAISTSELEALEFDSEKQDLDLDFLIVTTTGDVIKANLIDANESTFMFTSKRLRRIQIKRDSVYSLNRLNNPNLILLWENTLVGLDELKKIISIIILTNFLILMLLLYYLYFNDSTKRHKI